MKRKKIAKERNQFVALALFRKAGAHRKSNKALRKKDKAGVAQMVEQEAFNLKVHSSILCARTI